MRRLAKLLISFILAFLAIEGLVRTINLDRRVLGDPFKDDLFMMVFLVPDPYLQWRGRAGKNLVDSQECLNTHGFRAPEHSRKKQPGVIRVAVLGDSCSFGIVTTGPARFDTPRPYAGLLQSKTSSTGTSAPAASRC